MTDGGGAVDVIMAVSILDRIGTTQVSRCDPKARQTHLIDKARTMEPPGINRICESRLRLMTNLQSLLISHIFELLCKLSSKVKTHFFFLLALKEGFFFSNRNVGQTYFRFNLFLFLISVLYIYMCCIYLYEFYVLLAPL